MRILGELSLLAAMVGAGFAAFALIAGWARRHRAVVLAGRIASFVTLSALTVVMVVLAIALIGKDFSFAYVAQYCSRELPWPYALSALWVGQAGSLLLWAWMTALLAVAFGIPRRNQVDAPHDRRRAVSRAHGQTRLSLHPPRKLACARFRRSQREGKFRLPNHDPAWGVMMGICVFLVAIMVFGADPMASSLSVPHNGAGLSPLLQHPAMLIHPPIVFLGYSLWMVPFALVLVALATGNLDVQWVRQARPWAVAAWGTLGVGILLGADWAYEELGWGGYWGWDPVENGSLMPWLTGTALVHVLMCWQYRGTFKKTAASLTIVTFALCHFATFLTRSGIFSSLHAFSNSPIGWLFLILLAVLLIGGSILIWHRRHELAPDRSLPSLMTREGFVALATMALMVMTAVTLVGTLSTALSGVFLGRTVMVGPAFYNWVLMPVGLLLLATTALAPLLRWGAPPERAHWRWMVAAAMIGIAVAVVVAALRRGHPLEWAIAGLAGFAVASLIGALLLDAGRRAERRLPWRVIQALRVGRRTYLGFIIHLGLVCLAIGVTGSSLGKRERDVLLRPGQTLQWAGRQIRVARIRERELPDKVVGEAELQILSGGRPVAILWPARHFHRLQRHLTTEVAIHATWASDLYVVLHGTDEEGRIRMTFVENPLMRWIWLGGWVMGVGTVLVLWPRSVRRTKAGSARPPAQRSHVRRAAAAASWLLWICVGQIGIWS